MSDTTLPALGSENFLAELEQYMLALPQQECPVVHRFGPGLYVREVTIPADTFAVGHRQKFPQLNILLKGRVSILNANGSVSMLEAPLIYVGEPGRKCGYIHEEMVWQNIYATDETDIEKLEEMLIEKSPGWTEAARIAQLASQLHIENSGEKP